MEIRTKKIIRQYVTKDGGGTCRRAKVPERDEYYHRRRVQHIRPQEKHSPSYRIIETREPLRSRSSLNTLWRRDISPVRSKPFTMRMPYAIKRVSRGTDNCGPKEPKPRGRDRSPRPFVVDPAPWIRYAWPKSERPRSFSPEIRCFSPRRESFIPPTKPSLRRPSPRRLSPQRPSPLSLRRETETTMIVEGPPRQSRSLELSKGPRPARERTPVVEREPVRRRSRTVEIHQNPEQAREQTDSAGGRRQVRFAEDISYEEYGARPRRRNEYQLSGSDDYYRDEIQHRIFERRVPKDVDDRPRVRRISPERPTYRNTDLPRSTIRASRLRPRIIQDGDREISEAGDRIYAEARRRRYEDRCLRIFVSPSRARWRRRLDDIWDFSSDDDSYIRGMGSRRYGKRWL
ncbi:hypothetical protein BDW66DRAFT_126688 [Aspergillus desertorum]